MVNLVAEVETGFGSQRRQGRHCGSLGLIMNVGA